MEEEINGDTEDVYYVTCTARHTGAWHQNFKLFGFHEWDIDGSHYEANDAQRANTTLIYTSDTACTSTSMASLWLPFC